MTHDHTPRPTRPSPPHDPDRPPAATDTPGHGTAGDGLPNRVPGTESGNAPVDLVPGEPPVPITVWRTARTDTDGGGTFPARLAYRLVAAYTRPGDPVVDLTGDPALAGACAAGSRHHRRARFTDTAALTLAPATPRPDPTPPPDRHTSPGRDGAEPPDLRRWFGDDLTDPHLPPHTDNPADPPPPGAPSGPAAGLVVTGWPLAQDDDTSHQARLAGLLTATPELLRPGGCLVLAVGVPAGAEPTTEDFGPLVLAARAAGLRYLQHIVAVAAHTDGDAFLYHLHDHEPLAPDREGDGPPADGRPAAAHLRVHTDLLVFTLTAPTPAPRARTGGGRRG